MSRFQDIVEQCFQKSEENNFQPKIPYLAKQLIKSKNRVKLLQIQKDLQILPPEYMFSEIMRNVDFGLIKECDQQRQRYDKFQGKKIQHGEQLKEIQ